MTEILPKNSLQLEQLLKRIEQIETKLGISPSQDGIKSSANNAPRYCALPKVPPRTFDSSVSQDRVRLIRYIAKKWVNGTKLRYYFFESGPNSAGNEQKDVVRQGFEVWKNVGIGIKFEEVQNIGEAEIRIGFLRRNERREEEGSWSYIGRDVIDIPGQAERTMN